MANIHMEPTAVETDRIEREGERREDRRVKEAGSAGGVTEAFAGLAAVVLAILGLIGVLPLEFAAIGVIVVAGALLIEGGAIAGTVRRSTERRGVRMTDLPEVSSGVGAESLAAIGGIALGILALVRVDPAVLLPVAIIVLGAGLMFGSAAASRMNSARIAGPTTQDTAGTIAYEGVRTASGAHVLVGIAAIVLGIIALVSSGGLALTLVAVLCLGAAVLLSGAAIGGRLVDALHS